MPEDNLYITDAELLLEMARLLDQDVLLTREVSGLLPSDVSPEQSSAVLDLGCGPGGWVREVARVYPHLQVTGIDLSRRVIDYAVASAQAEQTPNAHFAVMDFRKLDYPDGVFDVVNARLIQWFVPNTERENVVHEWYRVLRPGGVIRLIENEITVRTNSEAFDQTTRYFLRALSRVGKSLTAAGGSSGSILVLRPLLAHLGCEPIKEEARMINFSAGSPAHEPMALDIERGISTISRFIWETKVVQKRTLEKLNAEELADLYASKFLGMTFFVCAWGRKPLAET